MRWSLNHLSLFLFNKAINKDQRLSKWSANPLTKDQQNYAAIDAFASYELYYAIKAKAHSFD
jgi:ribonuclease D